MTLIQRCYNRAMMYLRCVGALSCTIAWLTGCTFEPEGIPPGSGDHITGPSDGMADASPRDARWPLCMNDPDYREYVFHDHRYRNSPQAGAWNDARRACEGEEAHLAVIDTHEENYYVSGIARATKVWIGLGDIAMEGTFMWVTGVPLDFMNWHSDEPHDPGGHDCVELDESGLWRDEKCSKRMYFVCECDPGFVPPGDA